jgi:hypothetical protein
MDLNTFIEDKVDLPRLAQLLNEIGHKGRLWAIKRWTPALQAKLFEAAKGFKPIDLGHFVPPAVGPLVEVIHHGRNTLPAFTDFQKRFCRTSADSGVLYGYNHTGFITTNFAGPGYFVARPGETEGEVAIDYTLVPKERVESWPPIESNDTGFPGKRIVYGGMVDYLRGISDHVSIGRAFRGGQWADAWFALVREDKPAS